MKKILYVFLSVVLIFSLVGCASNNGLNTGDYLKKREQISLSNDYKMSAELTEKEKKADDILKNIKNDFLNNTDKKSYNIDFLKDSKVWDSELYRFCKNLPKSADLHVHTFALLPVDNMIDFLYNHENIVVNINKNEDVGKLMVNDGKLSESDGYVTVKEAIDSGKFTRDEFKKLFSLEGRKPEDDVWLYFENIFTKLSGIESDYNIIKDYYEEVFNYYCENNILHLEIRHAFFGNKEQSLNEASAIREAYYNVKKNYPDFLARIVGISFKSVDLDMNYIENVMNNALYVYENVFDESDPNNIQRFEVGIDLVNEEDRSRPLKDFYNIIQDAKKRFPDINIYLHAGESLLMDNDNVIDAYMMGSKRIGHGFNLYRYPDLMENIKNDDICIEVCPLSNYYLEYARDLRLHPAVEYMKRGIPIVITSDDPMFFEHTTLADDYFVAIAYWNIGISQLKQISMNNIKYSGLDDKNKDNLKKVWQAKWDGFIDNLLNQS